MKRTAKLAAMGSIALGIIGSAIAMYGSRAFQTDKSNHFGGLDCKYAAGHAKQNQPPVQPSTPPRLENFLSQISAANQIFLGVVERVDKKEGPKGKEAFSESTLKVPTVFKGSPGLIAKIRFR